MDMIMNIVLIVIPIITFTAKSVQTYKKAYAQPLRYALFVFFSCILITITLTYLLGIVVGSMANAYES